MPHFLFSTFAAPPLNSAASLVRWIYELRSGRNWSRSHPLAAPVFVRAFKRDERHDLPPSLVWKNSPPSMTDEFSHHSLSGRMSSACKSCPTKLTSTQKVGLPGGDEVCIAVPASKLARSPAEQQHRSICKDMSPSSSLPPNSIP